MEKESGFFVLKVTELIPIRRFSLEMSATEVLLKHTSALQEFDIRGLEHSLSS